MKHSADCDLELAEGPCTCKILPVIQVCQRCGKVDIIPLEHKKVCDPAGEARRQSDLYEDYK